MGVTVTQHGPFFNRELRSHIFHSYCVRTENALADRAMTMIRGYLVFTFKYEYPSRHHGLYLSVIHTERATPDHTIVVDTPVVYGPWLEGVGSRNFPVTRFPGYHAFRKVSQALDATSTITAEKEMPQFEREING